MNRYILRDLLMSILLMLTASGIAYAAMKSHWDYVVLLAIIGVFIVYKYYNQNRFLLNQLREFAEAVRYKDFTRRFVVKKSDTAEGVMFSAFNSINDTFKQISIDREIQQQYLNKVINMLDSAILFYESETGKVMWVNEAFKQLFEVPHLGNIKGLERKHPELLNKIRTLKIGSQQIETVHSSMGKIKLMIQNTSFDTADGKFRIVVYQNINEAIDETESKAWQKLLRVLTHEIMNSIAPISSLAETLHHRLEQGGLEENFEDLKVGMYTIKRRSEGLLQFAKSYRLINKVDQPSFENILLTQLFEDVYQLLEPTMLQKNIEVDVILKDTRLELEADRNLIEQVLINLILNAMEAVSTVDNPYISIAGIKKNEKVQIQVRDNGKGMSSDIQEQIFTPFFTTRKSGTGVGLTLSKQIMLLHNGNIQVDSEEGKGSTFTLNF